AERIDSSIVTEHVFLGDPQVKPPEVSKPAAEQPRAKRYKESDACPETGETDCPYCSGELCEKHGNEPCECDTADRHDKVAQPPEVSKPVPPEITEFLAHIEEDHGPLR